MDINEAAELEKRVFKYAIEIKAQDLTDGDILCFAPGEELQVGWPVLDAVLFCGKRVFKWAQAELVISAKKIEDEAGKQFIMLGLGSESGISRENCYLINAENTVMIKDYPDGSWPETVEAAFDQIDPKWKSKRLLRNYHEYGFTPTE